MRRSALLFVLFACLAFQAAPPAHAVESQLLDTLNKWLSEEHGLDWGSGKPDIENVKGLRKLAAKGDAEAQFLLFRSYLTAPRDDAGPRDAIDTLASRAEAEAGLRAAAAQGYPQAVGQLGVALYDGTAMRRDPAEARVWLEKAVQSGAPDQDGTAAERLGETLLFSPSASDADRTRGLALIDGAMKEGRNGTVRAKARALREGVGVEKDPEAARKLLEDAKEEGNPDAFAPLGDMLVKGEGGPQDVKRGMALLGDDHQSADGLGKALLAEIHLENKLVGREPRKAIGLMSAYATRDLATRQRLAGLMIDYREPVANAAVLNRKYREDEDVGEPDAAWTLLRLLRSSQDQFANNDELVFEVIKRNKDKDDRVALVDAEYLAKWSTDSQYAQTPFAKTARDRIDALAEKGMAMAWTLKGQLQRKGWAYPQDDVAATESFKQAAELGDPDGMVEVAEAYDDGLGIEKSYDEYLRWLRAAVRLGSMEAKSKLVGAFTFDWSERKITLREGITERVALYGDRNGFMDSFDFIGAFSGGRIDDFDREEVVAAFMDGFRLAPAGLAEDRLVPLMKNVPQEIRADIETVLKKEDFYHGDTKGYFRPDARAAFVAWAVAKGPLPDEANPSEQPPLVGPALPKLPDAVLKAALDNAFHKVDAASTDAEWTEALAMLAPLARYGEPVSRWALVRWYDQSALVGQAVSPQEITRYAIDLLLTNDVRMEKLSIEVNFAITELYKANKGQAFADGFLAELRDDPRLQQKQTLDDTLSELVFIPGGCDMLLAGAAKAGVTGLPADNCDNRETRDALLAYAQKAGPVGIETRAREAAAPEIYKIAGATPP